MDYRPKPPQKFSLSAEREKKKLLFPLTIYRKGCLTVAEREASAVSSASLSDNSERESDIMHSDNDSEGSKILQLLKCSTKVY